MDWSARTLIIDNFDSFTWNLVQLLENLGDSPFVIRVDDERLQALANNLPRRLVVSPGPGTPSSNPRAVQALATCLGHLPILGVCLGHQCLGAIFGADLLPSPTPTHGKTSLIEHSGKGLFLGVPNPIRVMRYHSLAFPAGSIKRPLVETAWCLSDNHSLVMAMQHEHQLAASVQFHPESFLTEHGSRILENFLSWT